MKVLVINCGSSSLKYQLIDSETETPLASGLCERIGIDGQLTHKVDGKKIKDEEKNAMPNHEVAVKLVLDELVDKEHGVIADLKEINAVGHRVVHGGEKFASSVIITDEVEKAIAECNDLAPLHNPANLIGIDACKKALPGVPMVAVFDTAFHQTMPEKAFMYGLPYRYYEEYKVRRYGFHGTSHSFVSKRLAELAGLQLENSKLIVCHIGNGGSVTAVQNGKSVDTSMGLTPLEGIIMGTRSGSIDPAIIEFIAHKENKSIDEIMTILNKKSGLAGMSGLTSDFRDLRAGKKEGNKQAEVTMDAFIYSIAKYVGAYAAAMNGVDAIAFTAGIGENAIEVRKGVMSYLGYLGVEADEEKCQITGEEVCVTTPSSKVKVFIIPTNEELAIARETKALVE
ncbi:acetate kinase [Clostridium sp. CAG:411]|jgi:acetate kinase|nr:acetate kinase [Lachnospiraceae bacterium]CDE45685.1 acetate kinase [Clostridium sp. CAG:411]